MKLTVIGCSGSFPSTESACSSYLVEADGYRLLLDMGNGALGELQRHIGLYDLDAVLLSHLHPDHCIDMCGYFVARYYRHDGGRADAIPVLGPEGTEKRLVTAYGDAPRRRLHGRGLRLPHAERGQCHAGPLQGDVGPGAAPRRGVRLPGRAQRLVIGLLRRHGPLRGARRAVQGHGPAAVRGVLHARQGRHPGPAPQWPPGGRMRGPRRG
ncbi:hypothetical protein GCM10020000_50780 [Streptomyces olivoverticillatus]